MGGGRGADAPSLAPLPDIAAAPRLVAPAVRCQASFIEALRECHAEGRHAELPAQKLADPEEFSRYVAALGAGAQRPGEPDFYLAALEQGPRPVSWPDGYVPQTVFWWVAGDAYLGRLSIRHRLTAHLLHEGGNLGFEVRPSARGRGHATTMLATALPLAAALGVDPARLDCEVFNVASRRVIEKNGGVLDEERNGSLFFWMPTR